MNPPPASVHSPRGLIARPPLFQSGAHVACGLALKTRGCAAVGGHCRAAQNAHARTRRANSGPQPRGGAGPITGEPAGIYLREDQSQGSHRVYTCVRTNHRGASGHIPAWGPIRGEPAGIYLCEDQSQGSQRVYTCVRTNHRGAGGYIPGC
eukprot:6168528-Pyramimonas_sp.AAC.1